MSKQSGIIPLSKENKVDLLRYGAIAMEGYTGNKKVPILGIDTSERLDIKEMLLIHQDMPPGDCLTQWSANWMNKKFLMLSFKFSRPSRISFYIPLFFHEHSWVIEGILQSKVIILKSANTEENSLEMINGIGNSITVEIGAGTNIPTDWEKWQTKSIKKHFKNKGLSKKEVNNKTSELILSSKEFWAEHIDFTE